MKRSACPIAGALDIIGDKWTLLIVRDMLYFDHHRYSEFQHADERIPTNILADRLRRLEEHGIIRKDAYQDKPRRYAYRLTEKGQDLAPLLREMVRWGLAHVEGAGPEQISTNLHR